MVTITWHVRIDATNTRAYQNLPFVLSLSLSLKRVTHPCFLSPSRDGGQLKPFVLKKIPIRVSLLLILFDSFSFQEVSENAEKQRWWRSFLQFW
ncbi:hypothetical protein SLE2022_227420 [Rubroshorea leprosula]